MTQPAALVRWLDEAEADDGAEVGGKFSSLVGMARAGFGVPPAFAVSTAAYRAFMRAGGLDERARRLHAALDRHDLTAVERAGGELQAAIEATPLPPELATAIDDAYARLCAEAGADEVPVAVRSSGVAEDLAGASFAGQYDTYLWVTGAEAVRRHVRRCWTGLFGATVLTYRPDDVDVPAGEIGMAVVVQRMVDPRAAGVMFTLDPVTGDRSKIVIEAAWGLGEAVVGGELTPDRYRVDKVTLELLEQVVADKAQQYRRLPDGGVALVAVEESRRARPALSQSQALELAALGKRIERHRGAPQDIEWALDEGGTLHVLQVRPETVWSRRPAPSVAGAGRSAVDLVLASFVPGAPRRADDGGAPPQR